MLFEAVPPASAGDGAIARLLRRVLDEPSEQYVDAARALVKSQRHELLAAGAIRVLMTLLVRFALQKQKSWDRLARKVADVLFALLDDRRGRRLALRDDVGVTTVAALLARRDWPLGQQIACVLVGAIDAPSSKLATTVVPMLDTALTTSPSPDVRRAARAALRVVLDGTQPDGAAADGLSTSALLELLQTKETPIVGGR